MPVPRPDSATTAAEREAPAARPQPAGQRRRKPRPGRRLSLAAQYWLARALLAAVAPLPVRTAQALGRGLGRLVWMLRPDYRARCDAHLALAFPAMPRAERRRIAAAAFRHMGMTLCEALNLRRLRAEGKRWVHTENERAFLDAHARGHGVVLVTAHTGNWELVPIVMDRLRVHTVAVVRPFPEPLNTLLARNRRSEHLELAHRGTDSSPRVLLNCLRAGNALLLAADQDTRVHGVFADFFGVPANTPRAPASLALKRGAPVVTYLDERRPDGTHMVHFREVPVTEAVRQAPDPVQALTQAITDALEAHIRAHPEQWAWHHERWKRRPPGEGTG